MPRSLLLASAAALLLVAPAAAITGGSPDGPAHPAVGLLLADHGSGPEPECTGSLVSPTVFVTAAHCVSDLASTLFWVSFDARFVVGVSQLRAGTAHADPAYGTSKTDSHDLAVVVLDQAFTDTVPLGLPRADSLNKAALKSQPFTNVGYGFADRTFVFDGLRRTSVSSFTTIDATDVKLSESSGGVCFGDSGGPRLIGSTVAAVTTSGNKNCTGQSVSYRLDTPSARGFLSQFVAVP
ncbi:MAG: trypsin-like serine protease [Actinobacteria bacterium]|nr:trypsin-like serine protease [Actinomycetota bacterium]